MLVRVCCFKNEFSEFTETSSPQTSPWLIVLDSKGIGKFKQCHPQTLN